MSYLLKYLVVKDTPLCGKGCFTSLKIKDNLPIVEYTGDVFNRDTRLPSSNDLQVSHNLFRTPCGNASDYINHSCNPNCRLQIIGNRAIVYSLYEIQIHQEITIDYSTSSTDSVEDWNMNCQCKNYNCRKNISGFQYLDEQTKQEYINKKMIPTFILNKIFK